MKRILMITDRSGSMEHLRHDVIGGQLAYLASLADDPDRDNIRLTQVLFHMRVEDVDWNVPVDKATRFDPALYRPDGGTALLDAIGGTIQRFRAAFPAEEGDRTLLFVMTDGAENSSTEWRHKDVAALLAEVEAEGWAVVYSGAGPAGWADQRDLGRGHASTMHPNTSAGTKSAYTNYAAATGKWSASGGLLRSAEVATEVQRGIDEDTKPA